jgi:hypothetical protein
VIPMIFFSIPFESQLSSKSTTALKFIYCLIRMHTTHGPCWISHWLNYCALIPWDRTKVIFYILNDNLLAWEMRVLCRGHVCGSICGSTSYFNFNFIKDRGIPSQQSEPLE